MIGSGMLVGKFELKSLKETETEPYKVVIILSSAPLKILS